MTDPAPPTPDLLPSGETLAVEVIAALVGEGYTSSVLKLPRPLLNEMARQLVTDWPPSETLEEWFAGKGHEVPARNIRRFVKRFKEKYNVVVGKHVLAQALADQSASGALTEFNRNRIQQVLAQKLLTITPEEMDPAELATIIRGVRLADMREHDSESLKITRDQAEARARKLEADLALSQREADRRESKLNADLTVLEQRSKLLQQQVEEQERRYQQAIDSAKKATATKASDSGGKLTEADVLSILDQAMKGEL